MSSVPSHRVARCAVTAVAVLGVVSAAPRVAAADFAARRDHNWHQWRGPQADGQAPHGDPPVTWDEETNIRWKAEIPGEGSATPIVWEDKVFLVAAVPTDRAAPPAAAAPDAKTTPPAVVYQFVVLCLDRLTGAQRWRHVACEEAPHEGRHPTNTYASASPTTDGDRLWVSFGSRGLYCYDLDGNLLWQRQLGRLRTRFGWGEGASPAHSGESLVVACDQEENSFLAVLDAQTGEERWRAARDEPTSWATPLVVEHDGRMQVVVNGTNRVRSYDLATGEELWQCGGQTVNAIPSPLAVAGTAICMSGYRGAAARAIPLDSRGDVTDGDAILWSLDRGTPYVPSPVLCGGQLYFTAGNTDVLTCVDVATGRPVFEPQRLDGLGNVYASPAAAAGRIYFVGRDGASVVIRHGPQLEVLATNRLDDEFDASPVIVGRQLLLRGKRHLYCIEEPEVAANASSTARAIRYLAQEVPRWSRENGCYSCHNNGDAARALYAARERGFQVEPDALAETTEWLRRPERWEHNAGEGPPIDKQLAAIQFAAALAAAVQTGAVADRAPMDQAADTVASLQQADGSWDAVDDGLVGTPVTYGDVLATAMSMRTLAAADGERFAPQIGRAETWLRARRPQSVLDAAATLLGLGDSAGERPQALREACRDVIRRGQHRSGGWGPFVSSRPEPFDTALVLLAVAPAADDEEKGWIERGRAYLVACQADDGSWPETTRPAGAESYAQRVSTTAWATLALLASEK